MHQKREYVVDGKCFDSLEEFAAHFSERVLIGFRWEGSLDAFNDILRGGFGTPEEGFVLLWQNSEVSRQRLGHAETVAVLERRLRECHPSNRMGVASKLAEAQRGEGSTVFDWLVEILRNHGPDGTEPEDGVELKLQ